MQWLLEMAVTNQRYILTAEALKEIWQTMIHFQQLQHFKKAKETPIFTSLL